MDEDLEWDDDLIEEEEPLDKLDAQIALAAFHLASLKMLKALRGMGKACTAAADALRAMSDSHVLSAEVVDEQPDS